ncbi:MAG: 50S ribosome-binding GTPase [Candidatus Nanoarchaeia archaeon]|nr:50S ribosome-binding GTPase [Candidatus Nanoarchaeia archaeon]
MPINAGPEYAAAEKKYFAAKTLEERIICLEEMIKTAPKHKSSENFVAELKRRLIKLKEKQEKDRTKKGGGRIGIKKDDMQVVIIGKTKSGKSSLLNALTNVKSPTGDYDFITKKPVVGVMDYFGVGIQIIEIPAIESEYYDRGLVNSADVVLLLVTDFKQIEEIKKVLEKACGKQIIVFNKTDLLNENEKRKIYANLQSRKYDFVLISAKEKENIPELKDKIFMNFDKIRVYTKEPGKEKSNKPIILEEDSSVKDVAEKILKGFSLRIKETKIWGPSSKFSGQKVGLKHRLKDMDVVEFRTR